MDGWIIHLYFKSNFNFVGLSLDTATTPTPLCSGLISSQAADFEVFSLRPQNCEHFSKHPPLAWCQTVCGVGEFSNPGGTLSIILDAAGLKIDKTLRLKCEQDVSNVWFVKFLCSSFGSVFFPCSRAAVDQCQRPVCWAGMRALRRSTNEALPARRWSCWELTFDLREPLSLSDWAASGGVAAPWACRRAAARVKARNSKPPSYCFQHRHRPIDRPQEGGGGGGGRMARRRRLSL